LSYGLETCKSKNQNQDQANLAIKTPIIQNKSKNRWENVFETENKSINKKVKHGRKIRGFQSESVGYAILTLLIKRVKSSLEKFQNSIKISSSVSQSDLTSLAAPDKREEVAELTVPSMLPLFLRKKGRINLW